MTVSPVFDARGRVIGASPLARDTSDPKRLERMKDEFIDVAAHELRSPLAAVLGFAELLETSWDSYDDEKRRYMVSRVSAAAEEMQAMIARLLDFSRLRSGTVVVRPEPVELAAGVHQVVAQLAPLADDRLVRVEVREGAYVLVDPFSFDHVLRNLLTNAFKYSESASEVLVTMELGGTDMMIVSVNDHGVGIPVDEQDLVFENLFRSSASGSVGGIGIGLGIAREHVELNGGAIWVESTPGQGSTFSFSLPRAERPDTS